jgi:TRAP transporter TAXI family solute receptor
MLAGCLGGGGDGVSWQVHTAAEGASHYNMSAPLVELMQDNSEDPSISVTVSSSDGSVANMRMLADGNTDVGTSVDQIAHLAYNGIGPFEGESVDLRLMARAEVVGQYYVVREGSDINSISDLDGKSVTPGPEGGGTTGQHQSLMEAFGIETNDTYLTYSEGGRALRDGDVDAWFIFHGAPVINAFATDGGNLRVLGFDEEEIGVVQETFPWTTQGEITPDMLQNYDRTAQVMGTNSFWITTPDKDADAVYEFVETATQNPQPIRDANVNSTEFGPEFAHYDFDVPYHEGAVSYFEDEGIVE